MSDILTLARAVAEELREYKAELLYFPEFELRDLDDLRIVVVPAGTQYKTLSRAAYEELPKVQIGILKRCREDALDEMLRFAEKLGLGFLNRKLAGGTCVSVIYNPKEPVFRSSTTPSTVRSICVSGGSSPASLNSYSKC